jgi:hypothetical protein
VSAVRELPPDMLMGPPLRPGHSPHDNDERPHGIDRDPLLATHHAACGCGEPIWAADEFSDHTDQPGPWHERC